MKRFSIDTSVTRNIQLIQGAKIAFARTNELLAQNMNEYLYNVSLVLNVLNDDDNSTLLDSNLNEILALPPGQVTGIMFSGNPTFATCIQQRINGSVPFINPASESLLLRVPFQRNIINIRTSDPTQLYFVLRYFSTQLGLQHFAFVYSQTPGISEAIDFLKTYCRSFGLQLTIIGTDNTPTNITSQILDAFPDVIIIWTEEDQVFTTILSPILSRFDKTAAKVVINYRGTATLATDDAAELPRDIPYAVYTTNFLPTYFIEEDFLLQIVQDYYQDAIKFSGNHTQAKNEVFTVLGFEGYYTGKTMTIFYSYLSFIFLNTFSFIYK